MTLVTKHTLGTTMALSPSERGEQHNKRMPGKAAQPGNAAQQGAGTTAESNEGEQKFKHFFLDF